MPCVAVPQFGSSSLAVLLVAVLAASMPTAAHGQAAVSNATAVNKLSNAKLSVKVAESFVFGALVGPGNVFYGPLVVKATCFFQAAKASGYHDVVDRVIAINFATVFKVRAAAQQSA